MESSQPQVLIVGAGPVGLTLAIQLRRFGVPVRIIDAAPEPSRETKAMAIHARTLELLRDLGVVDEFLAQGVRVERFSVHHLERTILRYDFTRLGTRYPFMLSLPQPDTERILGARLAALGVTVERRVELAELRQDAHAVQVVLRREGASQRELSYPWVVGCDGARSAVRRDLGVSFAGASYHRYFMLTDVDIDWHGAHDEGCFFLGRGDGYVGLAPIPGARRYRFFVEMPHDLPPPHARLPLTLETFQRIADERGQHMKLSNPSSMTMAEFRHRMVDRLRVGRVFLSGDAAHIGSPIGGQYMNLGINEAMNLGFKLAWVALGRAEPHLLDSYDQERMPVARKAERTAHVLTRLFTVTNPVLRAARNHVLPVVSKLEPVAARLPRGVSGHAFQYRGAGALADQVESARVERPALEKRKRPVRAGDLAPDLPLASGQSFTRLGDMFGGTGSLVLLFAGEVALDARHERLAQCAERLRAAHGSSVTPVLVWPAARAPRSDVTVVLDPDRRLHAAYGAASGGFYVVRPDGHLGYVGPDGIEADLTRYLRHTLGLTRAAAARELVPLLAGGAA